MEYLVLVVVYLLVLVMLLVSVAFVTLMEQKLLSSIQVRVGPQKVGFWGMLQPFADAVKLFVKELSYCRMGNFFFFFLMPSLSLMVILMLWMVLPCVFGGLNFELGVLFFFCVSGMGVFPILVEGWASNSKYSFLGGLRAVAQMVSYEVSLVMIILSLLWVCSSFSLSKILVLSQWSWGSFIFLPLMMIWFVSSLAETNRSPYDFSESESELVSGFNTEYSSGGFTLIFMAEYASILFMSMILSVFFLSSESGLFMMLKAMLVSFMFVWVRGTMPRLRYDKLMFLAWKSFLPISLFLFCYFLCY
uniref:NADH dehydrogenase subunit 1 n=1 Tax=Grandidierella taihuensis TaxID=2778875 RepID=UPI001BEDBD57|nr:NADH dehydrogenase subunit 1 [Grandidierella taihuensis]QTX95233.1 NADH dehydrogenase subunit 1 [Grandidierella taihuensis]